MSNSSQDWDHVETERASAVEDQYNRVKVRGRHLPAAELEHRCFSNRRELIYSVDSLSPPPLPW